MIDVCTALTSWIEADVVVALEDAADVRVVRRCADMAELVAFASAGRTDVVLLSPGVQGIDRSAVADLLSGGVGVVGIHQPLDEVEQRVLRQWGIEQVLASDAPLAQLEAAIAAARLTDVEPDVSPEVAQPAPIEDTADDEPAGRIIVVWGPHGAPGRTTVALNLAVESGGLGRQVLLVDLDLHAPSLAQTMGLLNEAPGVAAACRLAESGRLDVVSLAGVAPEVVDGVRVLTGLPLASRWPEIRPAAVAAVLAQARRLVDVVVIDVSAALDDDEELSYDTRAPRRNGSVLQALADADEVVVVAQADPVGLQRVVRSMNDLRAVTAAPQRVVVNKVRSSAAGTSPRAAVSKALQQFAGIDDVQLIADDRVALDKAMLQGLSLREIAPDSHARRDLVALAHAVAQLPEAGGGRHRLRMPSARRARPWRPSFLGTRGA